MLLYNLWNSGKMERWNSGRMEEWKNGRKRVGKLYCTFDHYMTIV
jgi:hypothetical protein